MVHSVGDAVGKGSVMLFSSCRTGWEKRVEGILVEKWLPVPSLPAPRAPFMAVEHEGSGPLGTSTCKGDLNNVCSFNLTPIIVGFSLRFHCCLKER